MNDLIDAASEFIKQLLKVVFLGNTDENPPPNDEKASD